MQNFQHTLQLKENLTFVQQSNNNNLTIIYMFKFYFCQIINWLFIIKVWLVKTKKSTFNYVGFFYLIVLIKLTTTLLNALGCSTFTTWPQFSITNNFEDLKWSLTTFLTEGKNI